jgi:HTH-type transcriptional regulator/antitoxin HigA
MASLNHIKLIRNADDHREALAELERLAAEDPPLGTPKGDRLRALAILVEDYEKLRFPIGRASPVDIIEFRMDQLGLRQKDLVPFIGSKSKVSEVLSGRRALSLNMIRSLSEGLDIPVELLVAKAPERKRRPRRRPLARTRPAASKRPRLRRSA